MMNLNQSSQTRDSLALVFSVLFIAGSASAEENASAPNRTDSSASNSQDLVESREAGSRRELNLAPIHVSDGTPVVAEFEAIGPCDSTGVCGSAGFRQSCFLGAICNCQDYALCFDANGQLIPDVIVPCDPYVAVGDCH